MRRPVLVGTLIGVVMALTSVAVTNIWVGENPSLYLRIADDDFVQLVDADEKPENQPTSARLARSCGIERFTLDLTALDHVGSAFVKIDGTSKAKLNCLIGEARRHSLSLAIVEGEDTSAFECLPGWPSRFRPFDASEYELCRGHKPDAIFRSTKDGG